MALVLCGYSLSRVDSDGTGAAAPVAATVSRESSADIVIVRSCCSPAHMFLYAASSALVRCSVQFGVIETTSLNENALSVMYSRSFNDLFVSS
jgi:hypothetical protein